MPLKGGISSAYIKTSYGHFQILQKRHFIVSIIQFLLKDFTTFTKHIKLYRLTVPMLLFIFFCVFSVKMNICEIYDILSMAFPFLKIYIRYFNLKYYNN